MFFLRCAFWLSVVYASMSWNDHRFGRTDLAAQVPALEAASPVVAGHVVAGSLAARAATACADHAADCLSDAARLSALVATIVDDAPSVQRAARPARRAL